MQRILVFQHVSVEHPGSFREVMAARGCQMTAIELDASEPIPPLDDFDILLVMGGPMDVWQEAEHPWLAAEKAAIRDWVGAGRPYLGLCLGEQLLAASCGGTVAPMTAPPEVGMSVVEQAAPDALFAGLPARIPCFQWHAAEVTKLPPGARLLAASSGCAVQAFGLGRHAYGLQFHLELTKTTAAEWGALPEYAAALEAAQGPGAMAALEAEVARSLEDLRRCAYQIFGNFLDIAAQVQSARAAAA